VTPARHATRRDDRRADPLAPLATRSRRRLALAAATVLFAATPAAAASASSSTAATPALSGGHCSIRLAAGEARITRTTSQVGDRFLTVVRLETTGNGWNIAVDRGHAGVTKGGWMRDARGAAGQVAAPVVWSFRSRRGAVLVSVAAVDANDPRFHGSAAC
jgi:hypothetical protein